MKNIDPRWSILAPSDRLYHMPVPILGLTGGVASGKSSVSHLLKKHDFKIIDADALVKKVYQQPDVITQIATVAPSSVINGTVDFITLRPLFFSDPSLQEKVEAIIYARLPGAFTQAYETDVKGTQNFIIYDVPLLFEKQLAPKVDTKICVWCPPEQQLERLVKRDGIDLELAKKMLTRQWPIDQKKQLSDFVIDNSGDPNQLESQVADFIAKLLIK